MEPSRWCIVLKCAAAVLLIAAVDAQSEKQFRLPKATKPIAYDIELAVDLEESMFSGSVKIELEAVQQTTVLALNAKDLALSNIALTDHNGERMGISSWGDQNGSEIVRFNLESPLEYPRTYFMNIQFAGIITGDLKGLYRSSYYQATEERFIGSTFNAAAYARRIFPCYDEPHLKAKFKLSVQHATDLHVLSNMHVESRTNLTNPENVSLTIFAQSPPMSTYLFAFVLSDYGELRLDSQFAAHAPLGIVNTTGYALNFTKTAIEYLAKFFKRPYQLPKLDIVTIDDFLLGAMENWGLITFKTSRIAFREGLETTEKLQSVTKIVLHELIHQWVGNEVTCDWWSYVWLNEGFTVYLESYILEQIHPEWRPMEQFLVNEEFEAMEYDELPAIRAMSKPVSSLGQLEEIYDIVAYSKAASIIRMISFVVGESSFRDFVPRYLEDRSYKTSTEDDFIRVLERSVDKRQMWVPPIREFVKSWTNNPSYPIVTVRRTYSNEIYITAVPVETFYIPLPWLSEFGSTGFEWFPPWANHKFILVTLDVSSSEWILFNPNRNGYYRVNYDTYNWSLLVAQLKKDHSKIPRLTRAQLIDDALYLARDNLLDVEILLNILTYLSNETDIVPLKAGLKAFKNLDRVLRGNDNYASYQAFQTNVVGKIYDKMLLNHQTDHISKLYRVEVRRRACELGVPKCLQEAVSLFDQFETIEPDMRAPVICGAMKGSDNFNIWAMVLRRMFYLVRNFEEKRINIEELNDILAGCGCATNEERLIHYLSISLSNAETIDQQDRIMMFNYIMLGGLKGTEIALRNLANDSSTLHKRYGSLYNIVSNLKYAISTQKQLQMYAAFIHNHTFEDIFFVQNEVYEIAKRNIKWANDNLPKIANWTASFHIDPQESAGDAFAARIILLFALVLGTMLYSLL